MTIYLWPVAFCISLISVGCSRQQPIQKPLTESSKSIEMGSETIIEFHDTTIDSPIKFMEVAKSWGIDFRHVSGMTSEKIVPTANGSGVAVIDYNNDGLMDLYFAQSSPIPVNPKAENTGKLFRNNGVGQFQDVTIESGLGLITYFTHGAIAADIDNDGDTDLYLCNFGKNVLFMNNGGHFTDISTTSGTDYDGWSSSAAFLDYDGDGLLDLYVSTYGDWKYPQDNQFCGDLKKNIRLYCDPKEIRPAPDILFKNLGSGKFVDVSAKAGINRADGHGFGVIAADFNQDNLTDIYVANDQDLNFLFINRGNGTFEDLTATSGAALDGRGHAQAGMGVDAEDLNADGFPEIIVTNFANESNTLYRNLGQGLFMDVSASWGIISASLPHVGWGTTLSDFDMDGWPDLYVANGHLDENRHLLGENVKQEQPALLFHNHNGHRFENISSKSGSYFASDHVGRGITWGDLDNDGDLDLVISHKDKFAAVLRNDSPHNGKHWLRLKLVGTKSNRDAIGARVEIEVDGHKITRMRKGGCGLMSTHDPRLIIGLGATEIVRSLKVYWPSSKISQLSQVETDQDLVLIEP